MPLRIVFLLFSFMCMALYAQQSTAAKSKHSTAGAALTVTYSLKVQSAKKNGHAESYNGSIKTVFIQGTQVRSRQVSLMRIQSVFYFQSATATDDSIFVVKETGKNPSAIRFTNMQWNLLNKKYANAKTELLSDSIQLLRYNCRKALITLSDGKQITVYYTAALTNNVYKLVEPAFKNIPGLVLQYEYESDGVVLRYTAKQITFAAIDPQVFRVPRL